MLAGVLLALVPMAEEVDSLVMLAVVAALMAGLIAIETRGYGEGRSHVRHAYYEDSPETWTRY